MVSRYSHSGKLLSQHCGIDKFKMSPQAHTYAPGPAPDQVAFQSYADYCRTVGVVAMTFETWYLWDQALNRADSQARRKFHNADDDITAGIGGYEKTPGIAEGYRDILEAATYSYLESRVF